MSNFPSYLALIFISLLGTPTVYSQLSQQKPMRDVAKHDDLSAKLRMAQQSDPIRELGPPAGNVEEDPSLAHTERDLIKTSTILSYRGFLTLVPKRAVLHIPEQLESRIQIATGAKVQTWRDFFQSNRGWIRTMEVTREQALGHTPFSTEAAAAIKESSVVVVATYKGGPISVLPPLAEEDVPTRSEMKTVTFR